MEQRRAWNVGCWKIPFEDRDVAHAVLTETDDRGFYNIIGADDDPTVPLGAPVTYRVELTDEEAARFRAASNCRYVELDVVATRDDWEGNGATPMPSEPSMAHMRARFPGWETWHGRDVPVAILDAGTTAAVRTYMGWTMQARQVFGPDDPGVDEITDTHGCLVAPCGVPDGGILLDGIIADNAGSATASAMAAGMVWAADQGCKIVNLSYSSTTGTTVYTDAIEYLQARGVQLVCSAGNDGLTSIYYPAAYSTTYSNVHSSIAFDEDTDARASFSNRAATGTGCAPGYQVSGLLPDGTPTLWNGTSASAPHMARLIAMGCTGGQRTAAQVAAALRANTRNTGQPASEQGAGAWDLHRALSALGLLPAVTDGVDDIQVVTASGSAATTNSYVLAGGAFQVGDARIVTITAGASVTMPTPAGWSLLREQADATLRVWVFGKSWATSEPSTTFDFDTATTFFSSFSVIVLRAASGPINLASIFPIVKFGSTTSVGSTVTHPYRTNDLLIAIHAQRDTAAPTGTLSLPAGLTQQGFWRPSSGTTGHKQLLSTRALTTADEAGPYTSTSNVTGGNVAVLIAVPAPTAASVALPSWVRGVQYGQLDTTTHTVTVTGPDNIQVGDLVLAVADWDFLGAAPVDTWELGWVGGSSSFDTALAVWRRVATSSEPASYGFAFDAAATSATVAVLAFDQTQVGTGWDVTPVIDQGYVISSTAAPFTQGLTVSSAQALNLAIFAARELTSGHAGHTPPSGMSELLDVVPTGSAPQRGLHIAGALVGPGSTGVRTATRSGSATGYITVPLAVVAVPLPPLPTFREDVTVTAQDLNNLSDNLALLYDIHQGGFRVRRPMAAARLTSGTATSGTTVLLAWGSEDYDTADLLTAGGQVFTVPAGLGGIYRLGLTVGCNAVTSAAGAVIRARIDVNSTTVAHADGAMITGADSAATCGTLTRLAVGDEVRFYLVQTSGNTATITPGTTRAHLRRIAL